MSNLTADQFNGLYPPGTRVVYQSVTGGEGIITKTRSEAWELGHGEPVVSVEALTGGVALSHVTVISADGHQSGDQKDG